MDSGFIGRCLMLSKRNKIKKIKKIVENRELILVNRCVICMVSDERNIL